jgi:hypothetical protein
MSESKDIRRLLRSWPYNPEESARIVSGDDGRELLQVRTPLGLEQLEMSGRPDGVRPHGEESALEFHTQRFEKAKSAGHEADFELETDDCAELFGEGTLYYFRYLHLFQLRRWAFTVRDTARNLRLFDFVNRHAAREEDRQNLEKWRPYVMRMNASASALLVLEQGEAAKSLVIVQNALDEIAALEELDDETFQFERQRSQMALRELLAQIERMQPVSPLDRLERQLRQAIASQEFERAAKLRDRIRELRAK